MPVHIKQYIVLLGDFALFLVALALTVFIRFPNEFMHQFYLHLSPFLILFPIWTIIFYVTDLYEPKTQKNDREFFSTLFTALTISAGFSTTFFYALFPFFNITPKTNLFIFFLFYFSLIAIWRRSFNNFNLHNNQNAVLLLGHNHITQAIKNQVDNNPQLGYKIVRWINTDKVLNFHSEIEKSITNQETWLIVIPDHLRHNLALIKSLYQQKLEYNVEIISTASFYENIFNKIPLREIEETWFLDNLTRHHKIFETIKWIFEMLLAWILVLILLIPSLLISLLIKFTSRGPILYSQTRIGLNNKPFTIYKFRTMVANAEKEGPKWARANDPRHTSFGRFLRRTHLDEIPQLINIILGHLSFVGPRPERPEFINDLKQQIPFYETRHLVKPGLTGWAQINYRYGASIADAEEKLQYELYYIKNRSFLLYWSILIKTIRTLISSPA